MKKALLVLGCGFLALSMTACGDSEPSESSGSGEAKKEIVKEKKTYESILADYTQKIQDATPGLVEEYNNESANLGSIEEKAELCNEKVEALAEICNDGVGEMAEVMMDNGDEYEVYEDWAGQLQDVYMDYANQIQDAYMANAM